MSRKLAPRCRSARICRCLCALVPLSGRLTPAQAINPHMKEGLARARAVITWMLEAEYRETQIHRLQLEVALLHLHTAGCRIEVDADADAQRREQLIPLVPQPCSASTPSVPGKPG